MYIFSACVFRMPGTFASHLLFWILITYPKFRQFAKINIAFLHLLFFIIFNKDIKTQLSIEYQLLGISNPACYNHIFHPVDLSLLVKLQYLLSHKFSI